jgi:hypothetical protein
MAVIEARRGMRPKVTIQKHFKKVPPITRALPHLLQPKVVCQGVWLRKTNPIAAAQK